MTIIGMMIGIIVVLFVLGGANYYIARRLYQCMYRIFPKINSKIYIGVYIFITLALILGFARSMLPFPMVVKNILNLISSYWMGIFIYLLLFFIVMDMLLLIGKLIKIIPNPIPHSIRFLGGLIVVLLTIGTVSYGVYNANQTNYVSYDVQTKRVLSGDLKIVMISDMHLGAIHAEKRLGSIVSRINHLNPDIVCIVGDMFNDDFNAINNHDKTRELLKSIVAKYGVYASLGNHDGGNSFHEMLIFLEQSNIKLLNDEYVIIDERVALFGRVDASPIRGFGDLKRIDTKEIQKSIATLDKNMPVVVMDHNPSNIEQYGGEVDLILSGHTHNGQIFPNNLITNAMYIVDYGYYQKNAESPHVIVSSGVGTWGMPMRIGTNNEIVSIILQ